MNLSKKKELATRTLNIGKSRIVFVASRKDEIKEAITKQDIRDLVESGAIKVKDIGGRTKVEKRKRKRGIGKIKKNVNTNKQDYVIMTRKLRKYAAEKHNRGEINKEELTDIRKRIRNRLFRSKAHLKSYVDGLRKWEKTYLWIWKFLTHSLNMRRFLSNENTKKKKKRK